MSAPSRAKPEWDRSCPWVAQVQIGAPADREAHTQVGRVDVADVDRPVLGLQSRPAYAREEGQERRTVGMQFVVRGVDRKPVARRPGRARAIAARMRAEQGKRRSEIVGFAISRRELYLANAVLRAPPQRLEVLVANRRQRVIGPADFAVEVNRERLPRPQAHPRQTRLELVADFVGVAFGGIGVFTRRSK